MLQDQTGRDSQAQTSLAGPRDLAGGGGGRVSPAHSVPRVTWDFRPDLHVPGSGTFPLVIRPMEEHIDKPFTNKKKFYLFFFPQREVELSPLVFKIQTHLLNSTNHLEWNP